MRKGISKEFKLWISHGFILLIFCQQVENSSVKKKDEGRPFTNNSIVIQHFSPSNQIVSYSLLNVTSKTIQIASHSLTEVKIYDVDRSTSAFLVAQAHLQSHSVILSYERNASKDNSVAGTSPALVLFLSNETKAIPFFYPTLTVSTNQTPSFYFHNSNEFNLSVLIIVRNYSLEDPIPGGFNKEYPFPIPFMTLDQTLLMTSVSIFPASSLISHSPKLEYEFYLTYMYEGDLQENDYWESVIMCSSVASLKNKATVVSRSVIMNGSNNVIEKLFVSYSGVGAVVTVLVRFNDTHESLYSTSVFYGCDFIPEEGYNCTKLVSFMAKFFVASLLFFGIVLLFLGHRWLNFTMFTSGFFFTWFATFVIFIHVPDANFNALRICTFIASLIGGVGWILFWHFVHRPFYSAVLIIFQSGLLLSMIIVHFIKYAIVPTSSNLALFVIIPLIIIVAVIVYSTIDIKRVHILSCSLLGSYLTIVPFSFYVGSSLTYIVNNIVSAMAVPGFSHVVGFPPFQNSDVALVCIWILLWAMGTAYQLYRERSSPPFQPPNRVFWEDIKAFLIFIREKLACCQESHDTDPDGLDSLSGGRGYESILSRCPLLPCKRGQDEHSPLSGYESFPPIGTPGPNDTIANPFVRRVHFSLRNWWERRHTWFSGIGGPSNASFDSQESLQRAILTEEVSSRDECPGEQQVPI